MLLSLVLAFCLSITHASATEADVDVEPFADAVAAADEPPAAPNPDVTIPEEPDQPVASTLNGADVTMSLPATGDATQVDLTSVYESEDGVQVAAEPTADGFRALLSIDDPAADERFPFTFGDEVRELVVNDDGSVLLVGADDAALGVVDAPWARDAAGRPVPTRFEVEGRTLTQVVEHRGAAVSYPVVADPRVFRCNLWTSWCVTFTRSETTAVARSSYSQSLSAFVATMCARIPNPLLAGGCVAAGVAIGLSLRNTFRNASANGRCAQIQFTSGGIPFRWKSVSC